MMILSGAPGPVGGGSRGLTQDDTYVEVGSLLAANGIRVPKIFVDGRDRGALLVEDVGDRSVLALTQNQSELASLDLGSDPLFTLYSRALGIKKQLIALPNNNCVIFERKTAPEQRAKQIREFLDHYAIPRGLSPSDCSVVEQLMDTVCARVAAHPLQVSHFDFMENMNGGDCDCNLHMTMNTIIKYWGE
jgi:aminoglycoside/choline kinase family phosphotransferase